MKIEKVIKQLESILDHACTMAASTDADDIWKEDIDALEFAITALRSVSREQVEKAWKGCSWCNNEGKNPENWECSLLDDRGFSVVVGDEAVWTNADFCPVCGKPLTDEAVQMVMERLEAVFQ